MGQAGWRVPPLSHLDLDPWYVLHSLASASWNSNNPCLLTGSELGRVFHVVYLTCCSRDTHYSTPFAEEEIQTKTLIHRAVTPRKRCKPLPSSFELAALVPFLEFFTSNIIGCDTYYCGTKIFLLGQEIICFA